MKGTALLLKLGCKKLPINLFEIISENGISLVPYSEISNDNTLKEKIMTNLSSDGFSFCQDGKYIIFYNDDIKNEFRIRWTLAHELIHIFSGHLDNGFLNSDAKLDKYVDYQTIKFLCPAIILKLCNVSSAEEIQKLCGVSFTVSQNAYERYIQKKDFQFYQFSEEEQLIGNNFSDFIDDYNKRKFIREIYF
ncbi:MAG: ImmA/IrrE family metallo-endopeptidase [Clostridia bacterium]|nr:ImmA/IrrE family metallo-endopeptidase [Clostridia bacterium]